MAERVSASDHGVDETPLHRVGEVAPDHDEEQRHTDRRQDYLLAQNRHRGKIPPRRCGRKGPISSAIDPYDPPAIQGDLPEALTPLLEALAARVHDAWARTRLDDGWTLGPERDDRLKTHPGLVPYDQLSESEKQYDRVMVQTVLRAILELPSPPHRDEVEALLRSVTPDDG